ncbi:MAG: hypothetical protein ACK55I_04520, partial [bacterium]
KAVVGGDPLRVLGLPELDRGQLLSQVVQVPLRRQQGRHDHDRKAGQREEPARVDAEERRGPRHRPSIGQRTPKTRKRPPAGRPLSCPPRIRWVRPDPGRSSGPRRQGPSRG